MIELGGGEVIGKIEAEVCVDRGERFQVEADVARRWTVDSVETVPREALAHWSVEGKQGAAAKLRIALAESLPKRQSDTAPVRLLIATRRPQTRLQRGLGIDDLTPLLFSDALQGRRLVWLRASEPYELELTGAETLTRVDLQSLDARARALFPEPPGEPLFENDAGAAGLSVSLTTRKPSYSATIEVEATVADHSLVESYRFHCVPEAARMDRVVIQFSHPRTARMRWTLDAGDEGDWTARRLPTADEAASASEPRADASKPEVETDASPPAPDGERWEIRLHGPRSAPFEIHASRTSNLSDGEAVSLASLPEAAVEQGTVVIRGLPGSAPVRIENERLDPIPIPTALAGHHSTARAAFRYDPVRDASPESGSELRVARLDPEAVLPSAWVWSCRLQSRFEASGAGQHLVAYRLENSGMARIRIALPPGVAAEDLRGVWVNDEPVTCRHLEDDADRSLAVDLPPGERFPVVFISFVTVGPRLRVVDSVPPPWPEIDLPVLARHWTVWLPPPYEAHHPDLCWQRPWTPFVGWAQRLFGPLGRPADQDPFDPSAFADWQSAVRREPARRSSEEKAGRLLRYLGERTAQALDGQGTGGLVWETLLADTSLKTLLGGVLSDGTKLELLVDREALAQLGLAPSSPVRPLPGGAIGDPGVALIQRTGLVLLVHPSAIVVTSAAAAAEYRIQLGPVDNAALKPLERGVLRWIRRGPLYEQAKRAAAKEPDHAFMPIDLWLQQPAESKVPWTVARPGGFEPVDTWGWTAYRLETSGLTPVRLELVRHDTMRVCRWATFLAVIGLGWWKALRRPAILATSVGLFGAAAFLLPETYAGMATGAVLGTLFVCTLRLISPKRPGGNSPLPSSNTSGPLARGTAPIRIGVLLVAVLATLVFCASAHGGEAAAKPPPPWAPAYGVLIPTDDEGEPTGDKYQVPEEFHRALDRLATAAAEPPQGFLVRAARYDGELTWQPSPERLTLSELTATFDVEVLSPSARVLIPFGGEGPSLLPDGVLLDDRSIQPEQQESSLVFTVSEPGHHLLTLALKPTMRPSAASDGSLSGFDLAIPRLPTSRLKLTIPDDAPLIDVPEAAGSVRQDLKASPPRLEAELGPTDRLSVRWPDRTGRNGSGRSIDVEQLFWLKVEPGSVMLETRFRLNAGESRVGELRLSADPRLSLQPGEGAQIHTLPDPLQPGPLQTIRLEFTEPLSGQRTVEATFQVQDASGIGNLRLPHLEVLDCHSTQRWMAVSVDPSLDGKEQATQQWPKVSPSDFLAAWGETTLQPLSVYSLTTSSEPRWSIATRPLEPRTTVDQTLAWSFAPGQADVRLDARLDTTAGYRFQYRLSAPPKLEVESVSLVEDTAERVDRWRRAPDGTITIFLKRAVADEQILSLRGHLPTSARGELPLPVLEINGAELQSSVIQLFRTPDVQVEVSKKSGLIEVEAAVADEGQVPLGRLVKCFQRDLALPVAAALTLSPNRPAVRARQTTSLYSEGEVWKAKAEFQIDVSRGVLDEFRLTMPPQCPGPYEIDPPTTWSKEEEDDGTGVRRLVIRPATPVTGEHHFSVSCPLTPAPGDRVGAAEIVLEQAELEEHLLVLPTRSASLPIAWETGLAEVPLREGLLPPGSAPGSVIAYRVDQGPLEAVLRPPVEAPEVRLLDIRVAWQADGVCFGVATFDLESAGMRECLLRLPDGHELVHVQVADVPTTPVPVGQDRWHIRLGPKGLPQRVDVVFRGKVSGPDPMGRLSLVPPTLHEPSVDALPVRQTLWTVSCPSLYQPESQDTLVGLRSCGPLELALVRSENLGALIDRAAGRSPEDPGETTPWRRGWLRRYVALRNEVGRQQALAGPTAPTGALQAELRSVAEKATRVADRIGARDVLSEPTPDAFAAELPGGIWRRVLDRSPPSVYGMAAEESGPITLRYRRMDADALTHRLLATAGLSGVILLTLLGLRRGLFAMLWRRWPYLLGVVTGLAWWLWLWPSVLGWGVAVLSLMASFQWGWRRPRRSGSAIVPLSVVRR